SVDVGRAPKQLRGRWASQPIHQVAGDLERYFGFSRTRRDGVLQGGVAGNGRERFFVGLKPLGMQAERVFDKIHQAVAIGIGGGATNGVVRDRVWTPKERAPGFVSERPGRAAG